MKVELFYSPGCSQCAAAREGLKAIAEQTVTCIEWHELNVLEELDHAVEVGVLTLPAVVVDGKLLFSSLPTQHQLREALIRRSAAGKYMEPDALRQAVEQAGKTAVGNCFLHRPVFSFTSRGPAPPSPPPRPRSP